MKKHLLLWLLLIIVRTSFAQCPPMNQPQNMQVCNGTTTTVNFTSSTANVVYAWINSNPAIGLAGSSLANSPAISANNNAVVNTLTDLAGNSRTRDNKVDIGAYEDQSIVLQPDAAGIIYVKQNGAGSFNGSSWVNAAPELADALLAAKSNTAIKQIWVAGGTYKPKYRPDNLSGANPNDRDNTFLMVKDVKLYGGFAGAETDIGQRDFSIAGNKTTLSGDLGTASDINDNTYHVVISAGNAGTAQLDGFTITGGKANGTGINAITVNQKTIYQANGGGMYNVDSSPTILNCIFNQNTTPQRGGAMFNSNASPIIGNCSFTNNSATDVNNAYAGAMYNSSSNPVITNCIFDGNTGARYGGAMHNTSSAPIIVNSIFKNNRTTSSSGNGGAVYNQNSSSSKFTNTLFYNNFANGSGGAFYNDSSAPSVTNCTFYGNTVSSNSLNGQSVFTNGNNFALNNSILWVNDSFIADGVLSGSVTGANNFIQQTGGPLSNPVALYTAAQLFTDAPNGNLTLKANSPAINAGNNAVVNTFTDLAGNSRTRDNKVDIGAYEVQSGNTIVSMVPAANGILYVKQGSAGNGSSWANAAPELADALLAAKSNTTIKQIWVAKGTYKPLYKAAEVDNGNVPTTDRDKAFVMVKDVKLYGGFAGTETDINQRDLTNTANATTLSGDLGTAGNTTDNAYHVLISVGDAGTAELNGFTITGGNADGANTASNISVNGVRVSRYFGGGMYNSSSSPTLSSVTLSNNTANYGGGMSNDNSSPTLSSVTLSNNTATNYGGGMYNDRSSPTLSNVTLSNNKATNNSGGAMYNDRSSPTLSNVTLSNNKATNGGGILNYMSSPTLSSVTLSNNTATSNGGAMYNLSSSPTISQSKFAGNTATSLGGAVYNGNNASVKVSNSSITGNRANLGGAVFKEGGGTDTFLNCTIAGNYANNDGGGINTKTANTTTNLINTIVYGNTKTANANPSDIRNDDNNATINVNYSSYGAVTGSISGSNNKVNVNPISIFTNPISPTSANTPNTSGDYTLKTGSPAIGAGNNSLYTGNINTDKDLAGSPRLTGSNIDMGAYEDQSIVLQPNATGIVYVRQNGAGSFNGSSWTNAAPELADALLAAKTNAAIKQIWVAKGTYKPKYRPDNLNGTNPNDRDNAFLMVKDVKLYGGFAGTETDIGQRDFSIATNTTTLSGDLGTASDISDNAYHVVISVGAVGTAELNGFTLTGGNADAASNISVNGNQVLRSRGGGMYNYSSSPTLSNVKLSNNTATLGGGMYNYNSSPALSNVILSNNTATYYGGGMYNYNSSPALSNVTLSNNTAPFGGGMLNYNSSPTLSSVTISNNTATNGAGIYNNISSLTISQSKFAGNTAADAGGAVYNLNASVKVNNSSITGNKANWGGAVFKEGGGTDIFLNCTIAGNYAGSDGGGINTKTSNTTTNLINTIVYGNTKTASADASDIRNDDGNAIINVNYSSYGAVTGTIAGGNNTTANPIFTNPTLPTSANTPNTTGDYTLKPGSPAIGAGDNSLYTSNGGNLTADKDLAGSPRLTGSNIDMGAYEALVQLQTINPIAAITKTYGDAAFEPGATASSGLTVSYLSADNSIAEAYQDASDGNKWKLKIKTAGTVNITASQAGGNGYEPAADVVFSLTVNQKPVMVSIKSNTVFTKVYDAGTAGTMQATDLELASGDVLNSDDVQLSLSSATAQYDTKDAGTAKTMTLPIISVVLAGAQAGNYKVANTSDLSTATAAITPKPLTITANNFSKVYDGSAYSGGNGVSYSAFALGEDQTVLSGTLEYGGSSQGATGTGSYVIVPSGLSSVNYAISYVNGQLSISLNNVNVLTFNAQTAGSTLVKTYGDADINASAIASSGLTASYQSSNPAVATVNASGQVSLLQTGTATITVTQAGDANYAAASPISFQVQVAKKLLTITANDFSKTYDGIAYSGGNGVSYSGFSLGEGPSVLGGTLVYGGTSQGAVNTGNYSITPSGLTATNYDFDYKNGTLGIVQSGANVITFNSQVAGATQQLTYGSATIDASAIASSGLAISYSSSNPAVASVNASGQVQILAAGTATITASQPGDSNHTAAVPVSFTVNVQQKALTITANNFNKVYDGQVYTTGNGVAYHGFVNGENEQHLQGSLSYAGTAIGAKNVGSYFITPGGYTSANYAITYQDGSLTISKANLTVTADAKTKIYGTADPALTYKVTGMVNNDAATVVTGTLKRAAGENVGTYAISNNDLAASNYTITYVGADLTITKANLTVTADAKTKVYGTADPALTYKVTGMVNNDAATVVTGTLRRATGENVGTYTISNNDLAASNYTITYVGANLTITKANLTVTADAKTKVYGTADPSLTYKVTGMVNNDAATVVTGTLKRATGENVGTYAISNNDLSASNYTITYVGANLTITKAAISGITLSDASFTYDATAKSILIAGTLPAGTTVSYTGNNQTAAGTYTVTANIDGGINYTNLTLQAALKINKA
ncbi:MBG domain-containing protein, partial [Sphingobacterium spiritivorum]|uniref:MBG domain-containing protein n=2 Tax=Sphingobacterium spiritivorum TaxID=258 RepID=UPI003DA26E3F